MNKTLLPLLAILFATNIYAQDTSFEASDNYSLGEINGQNGWEVLSFISAAYTISDEQASEGSYALKLDVDQTGIIPGGSIAGPIKT
ncbi:hypothetical protein [Psychroflexus halocasei]|uniref:Uncharacterized protein n=1 Tax=Psychroflexus halocasei TaxID=908615 RepID=A0A1H3ZSZ0_9FLAO|nr:hypothetical protein [Psychroflexus halocasei]SEA26873.1 hypothetical protein SAMN05421540_104200 [Psychroflexus halocasei]